VGNEERQSELSDESEVRVTTDNRLLTTEISSFNEQEDVHGLSSWLSIIAEFGKIYYYIYENILLN
jgi:hypothetical protein